VTAASVPAAAAPRPTDDPDGWLYDLRWKALPCPDTADTPSQRGTWLVFSDSGPFGRAVVRGLAAEGQDTVVVTAAATYQAAVDRFRINPADPAHYTAVLDDVAQRDGLRGIVHLWSLDAEAGLHATGKEVERAQLLSCGSVVHLVQALEAQELPGAPALWLISQHAQRIAAEDRHVAPFQAPLWGLGRTLAAEHPALRTRLVDLDRNSKSVAALVGNLLAPDDEDQIALRDGTRQVARLVPRHGPSTGEEPVAARLSLPRPGISGVPHLTPEPLPALAADEVAIRVSHAALDCLNLPGAEPLSTGCSGTVIAVGEDVREVAVGDQVIALAKSATATHVVTKAILTAPKPAGTTLAEAATLPGAYLTAYHALHDLARVGKGDRVLVHAATDGPGLAAVNVARWLGADVHATAGSPAEMNWLAERGIRHVTDSRASEFSSVFRAATRGAGFDAIVNSLTGDAVRANLSLMAPYGHYLELTTRDTTDDTPLNRDLFVPNLSFHAIDVVHMIRHQPHRAGAVLRATADLVGKGILAPLAHHEIDAAQAGQALQSAARRGHIGEIVLAFTDDVLPAQPARRKTTASVPVHPVGTYLITGGAGGIGGRLASWLVDQGARTLLLTGRTALPDPSAAAPDHPRAAQSAVLRDLARRGVDVQYAAVDVADYQAVRALLDERARNGKAPLRGVFHAAGTYDNVPVRDMTARQLTSLLSAKVSGAWNLHRLVRDLPVDMFVLFSSGSSVLSSPLLGGYAAGNAFLDALAHYRLTEGAPAVSVNWGYWDSVGMIARKEEEDGRSPLPQGMSSFSPDEGLTVLGDILSEGASHAVVLRTDWPTWARVYPEAARVPLLEDLITRAPRTMPHTPAAAVQAAEPRASRTVQPDPAIPVPAQQVVTDPGVVEALKKAAAEILGLKLERLNASRPLNKMGMDSMMAVQLRNSIDRQFQVKLPMVEILRGSSLHSLAQAVADAKAAMETDATPEGASSK
jgi:NADPH:quinone reductase-like Zn-dependent oxidoreductase/acyl carrier protein